MWNYPNGKAGMVIYDIQRITVPTIFHSELAFEICLPHLVAALFFKANKRLPFLGLLRTDTVVTMKNVIDRFGARDILVTFLYKNISNCSGTPTGIVRSNRQDKLLYFLRCFGWTGMRSPASVCEGLLRCVAFPPFIPCMPGYAELTAQGAKVVATFSSLRKFSSLVFHSSTLPRHLTALLCLFLMPLLYYKTVYHVFTHLCTMLLHCTL